MYMEEENNTFGTGDPSGLSGTFEDANLSLKTKMKEDKTLPHFITTKAAS